MLYDIGHEARPEEALAGDANSNLSLELSVASHLSQSLLHGLKLSFVLVLWLGHVGEKVAILHILSPGLLVIAAAGIAKLWWSAAKVDNLRVLDHIIRVL